MAAVYEVVKTSDKGNAMFATQDIQAGTVILRERPALIIEKRSDWGRVDEAHIVQAVDALRPDDQDKFFALFEGKDSVHQTREARIFHINCFGAPEEEASYVYLEISRANHSCSPNATDIQMTDNWRDGGALTAMKAIKKGEEICISYKPEWCSCLTRDQRRAFFEKNWGFFCRCVACDQDDDAIKLSNARRKIICALRQKLYHGKSPSLPDDIFTTLHPATIAHRMHALFSERYNDISLLSQSRNVQYNALLARCLEAEGMVGDWIVDHYFAEARGLVARMAEKNDNFVLLEWAARAIFWIKVCVALLKRIHGDDSKMLDDIREGWEKTAPPELKIALALMEASEGMTHLPESWSVDALMSGWSGIGSVLPKEDAKLEYEAPKAFAFWFSARDDGEPVVEYLTREQCLQFMENQKDPLVLAQVKQQGDAFLRRWASAAEGRGILAYVTPEDEASERTCVQS